jgi:superfamily II DNA helicase RecQ
MRYQFITVRALHPDEGQEELNRFCAGHTIAEIDKCFVTAGSESYWSFCIQYTVRGARSKSEKIDYREVLSQPDFAVYAKLRTLRKSLSEKDGAPLYAIFNNEQLADMVRQRVVTERALLEIDGVGKARVAKYGSEFLALLKSELGQAEDHEKGAGHEKDED